MALKLGALPYFMQYEQQANQQRMQQQEAAMRMQAFQQQQQDRQRQQAALQAAGNALPQLMAPPPGMQMQPGSFPGTGPSPAAPMMPQPPMPGQGSQPMVQPGAAGGAAQPKPPIQPFRPMPTSPPPQAAAPGSIPPPPQAAAPQLPQQPGAGMTLQGAIEALRAQGLEGADLMAGLGQLTPILDAQGKAQAAQIQSNFNNELKLAQLQHQKDVLDEREREAKERAKDRTLDRESRDRQNAVLNDIRRQQIAVRVQSAQTKLQGDPNAALDKDTLKFMAENYWAGDKSVKQNMGRGVQGSKNMVAFWKEVQEEGKAQGKSAADLAAAQAQYAGETAGARTAGTKAANVELAAAEAQKTMGIAKELSDKLPRTGFVPANRAIQAWQTNTGDPQVIAFGAALNTVVNAYARAISPSGTPTVSDKEHARQMLSTANTKAQFDSVINVMNQEMAAARKAPREVMEAQRERMTGRGEKPAAAPAIPAGWTVKER